MGGLTKGERDNEVLITAFWTLSKGKGHVLGGLVAWHVQPPSEESLV